MKDSLLIKFLYGTVSGRTMLKILVAPRVSELAARFLTSRYSAWLIPSFIRKNKIEMSRYVIPPGGYRSFNDFFTRKLKEEYRVRNGGMLICPCDGLLTVSKIDDDLTFSIKHTEYSIRELLGNEALAAEYDGGTAYVFRLTPAHYHRYVFCTTGVLLGRKRIRGILHSVQPICHEKTKVFVQNTREYVVIKNQILGKVVQMEIGALLVGKISNQKRKKQEFVRGGQEKGYFEYGGSSIVVLTKKDAELPENLLHRDAIGTELPVMAGETLINFIGGGVEAWELERQRK